MGSGSSKETRKEKKSGRQEKPSTVSVIMAANMLRDSGNNMFREEGAQYRKWESTNIETFMQKMSLSQHWYDCIDYLCADKVPVVKPRTKQKGWRIVRLFISSTFKDMNSEREHLVKVVIPQLQQWCQDRKIRLIECDLRWGIPEGADTRDTLLTCLSEIDRGRQENEYVYFLNMLSERYGFVLNVEEVPDDIKTKYKWLPGMSITALEIMTGAYWDNNPHALFMIRKPDFLQDVDEDMKPVYIETESSAIESLKILKEKIKHRFPGQVSEYDCKVISHADKQIILGSLDQFGEVVINHFRKQISEQYPDLSLEKEASDTEIRKAQQEDFMLQRSQILLGRENEIEQVESYIMSVTASANVLAMVGFPGAGKSALMAYCVKKWLEYPNLKIVYHFVGATPDSTSLYSILSRIYKECLPQDQQESIPLDVDELIRFVPTMLQQAVKQARTQGCELLVLFIDALNQIDDDGSSHKLNWLPRELPEGMRVIVSTLEGECLKALRDHAVKAKEIYVNPLNEKIRESIAQQIFLPYNKRLDDKQMGLLIGKGDSGNPLYLSIACEELRVFGEFRNLTKKITSLPDDLLGLLKLVIERTTKEYGGDLMKTSLCLIETSRFGLDEEELLHLLPSKSVSCDQSGEDLTEDFKERLPMAVWGFLYVGLRPFLRPSGSSGEGRLDFYHRSISKVIRQLYLSDEKVRAAYHLHLIKFFSTCSDIRRKAEELPYHYLQIGDQEGLQKCLLTREMFEFLYTEKNKQILMRYWQAAGGYQVAASKYQAFLQDHLSGKLQDDKEGELLETKVGWFLVDIGEYDTADEVLGSVIKKLKTKYGKEAVELADPLHAMMTLIFRKGAFIHFTTATTFTIVLRRHKVLLQQINRKLLAPKSNRLGEVLCLCGYFKSSFLNEAQDIFTSNNNKVGLAVVLYHLGERNQYNEDINVPIKLFQESLSLCRLYFGTYHLNTGRCVQLFGQLYWNRRNSDKNTVLITECLKYYMLELDILQEVLGHAHPNTVRSRNDVIIILQNLGRDDEAQVYLAQQPQN
ncbi:hypothetical protein C0Q70_09917 [Pomacea canaliculata]|uniref:Uncharacterized protein n=1 Tax=Pomacea canaliculata TaxID=400727 RepID=A0A2T7PB48_POMCA|nr:hypothetical protein C0Q70_09917 [Pomacea canaliculata]